MENNVVPKNSPEKSKKKQMIPILSAALHELKALFISASVDESLKLASMLFFIVEKISKRLVK